MNPLPRREGQGVGIPGGNTRMQKPCTPGTLQDAKGPGFRKNFLVLYTAPIADE